MSTQIVEVSRPLAQMQQVSLMDYALTPDRVQQQIETIGKLMKSIMKPDVHYGVIPGTKKPSLYLAGAEFLGLMFRIEGEMNTTYVDLGSGHREYTTVCVGIHIPTGTRLGNGTGICSTMESKYRWRNAERRCPNCGAEAIIKGKAEYGGGWLCFARKGGCGSKFKTGDSTIEQQIVGKVENADPADMWHTASMMSQKRSYVAMIRRVTGASTFVTQDLEDMFSGLNGEIDETAFGAAYEQAPPPEPPQEEKTEAPKEEPKVQPPTRRRTNKFAVNPNEWDGITELSTCGIEPQDILEIRAIYNSNKAAKAEILKYLIEIGYPVIDPKTRKESYGKEAVTFLRKDEADAFIKRFVAEPKTEPEEKPAEQPEAGGLFCDALNMDVKDEFCLNECKNRSDMGFCPIRGEDAPEVNLG